MTAVTIDEFEQIERRADRTLAVAYGFRHVRNIVLCTAALGIVNSALRRLLDKSLSPDKLEPLTQAQAAELTKKLQQLHAVLLAMLRACGPVLRSHFLFRKSITGLEASTEDLADIIEDLVLADNPKFRTLLKDSIQALSPVETAGLVGRM